MTKALYIVGTVLVIAAAFGVYWYNLQECMTQFSTFYCVTQVN
jgi:hypothetical protein